MNNFRENDIYKAGESFCNITIKLHEQIRIQRRTYKKLIEILANFGGFMYTISTIINSILFFHINTLYEIDIFNKLFKFDLRSNTIKIKKLPKLKLITDSQSLNNNNNNININNNIETNNNNIETNNNNIETNNNNIKTNNNNNNDNNIINIKYFNSNNIDSNNIINDNIDNNNNIDRDRNPENFYAQDRNRGDNIKLNPFLVFFYPFWPRKIKNKNIILIEKGINIFTYFFNHFFLFSYNMMEK